MTDDEKLAQLIIALARCVDAIQQPAGSQMTESMCQLKLNCAYREFRAILDEIATDAK